MESRGLELREPIVSDFEPIFSIMQDPVANEMSMVNSRTREAFRTQWEQRFDDQAACVLRTIVLDGEVVGRVNSFPSGDEIHVGYRIARSHWGGGIMSEVLRRFLALVEHRPLYARAAKSNVGSWRVLEKNGFELIDEYESPETDRYRACVEVKYELR
jgi:RimJ/RimL family protein N-acetyltransferase